MFASVLGRFTKDLGIDLGTTNTLVYVAEKGIVINEPSVVAVNQRTGQLVAVGEDALKMVGKTPGHIQAIRPVVDGVISDFEVTQKMLAYFIDKVHRDGFSLLPRPRVVVGIPLDITEVERKAVEDAVLSAGAREVRLVEQPVAAAVGSRLPIQEAAGTLVVEIGGGSTAVAVISLSGVVSWRSLRVAGNKMDEEIISYVREEENVLLGERTAERVKAQIGTASEPEQPLEVTVKGRDLRTGLPREVTLDDRQVREALQGPLKQIVAAIKATIEATPPELTSDIFERGMLLSGGVAQLRGLPELLAKETKVPVHVANDPLTTVVRGTGIIVEHLATLGEVLMPPTQGRR
jgi:rod shape-determining protein MreB